MVSPVTSSTYSNYLNQLSGANTAAATSVSSASGASTAGSSATSTDKSLVTSLLSGGAYSTSVLSLLQQNDSGSFNPIATLLDGPTTDSGITSLNDSLYSAVSAAALTQAQSDSTVTAGTSPSSGSGSSAVNTPTTAQSLIAAQTQASVAYNQTIQQNAATALSANSYGPNGVIKLVS